MNQCWQNKNQIFLRYKYIYIYNEIVNCYSQFHVRVENLQTVDPRREIRCNNNFILLYILHSLIVYMCAVIAIYIYKYIYIYIYIYIYMCTVIADIFLIGKFISYPGECDLMGNHENTAWFSHECIFLPLYVLTCTKIRHRPD